MAVRNSRAFLASRLRGNPHCCWLDTPFQNLLHPSAGNLDTSEKWTKNAIVGARPSRFPNRRSNEPCPRLTERTGSDKRSNRSRSNDARAQAQSLWRRICWGGSERSRKPEIPARTVCSRPWRGTSAGGANGPKTSLILLPQPGANSPTRCRLGDRRCSISNMLDEESPHAMLVLQPSCPQSRRDMVVGDWNLGLGRREKASPGLGIASSTLARFGAGNNAKRAELGLPMRLSPCVRMGQTPPYGELASTP